MTRAGRVASPSQKVLATSLSLSRGIAVGALAAGIGLGLLPSGEIATTLTLSLAAAGLLAGLPHGSVDHLLAVRATGRSAGVVVAAYAGVAALTWVGLVTGGLVVLAAVIALSVVHFGLGEAYVYQRCLGWHPGRVVGVCVAVAGSGALVLPLARGGDLVQTVAAALSPGMAVVVSSGPARVLLATAWILAAAVAVTAAWRTGRPGVALDVVLIGGLGTLAPPLIAFAAWFGGWHAVRHTARLLVTEPGCAALIDSGQRRGALRRLVRLGAVASLAAAVVLALLVVGTAKAPDLDRAVAEGLRLLLALTVPHMLVVLWLDRQPDAVTL